MAWVPLIIADKGVVDTAAYETGEVLIDSDGRAFGKTLVDGGVWANNPTLLAVHMALKLSASLHDICALSLGAGVQHKPTGFGKQWGDSWVNPLHAYPLLMGASSIGAHVQTANLLGTVMTPAPMPGVLQGACKAGRLRYLQ